MTLYGGNGCGMDITGYGVSPAEHSRTATRIPDPDIPRPMIPYPDTPYPDTSYSDISSRRLIGARVFARITQPDKPTPDARGARVPQFISIACEPIVGVQGP